MRMRRTGLAVLLTGVVMLSASCAQPQAATVNTQLKVTAHSKTDVHEGWRLGVQAFSFRRFTFYETVDYVASLGLGWIEAYSKQKLSKEKPDVIFGHTMDPALRDEVKQKLALSGVKLVNYGVVKLSTDEAECREVFEFAKDMGIETLIVEPPEEAFDLVERLCKEYLIKAAIHNHAKPSYYWNPDTVLEICQVRSKWIGASGDTGHWMRSGVDPVQALKKLEGRHISVHLKDMDKFGTREAQGVVWGTGKADMKGMLAELHRQGFKGTIIIEYESNPENPFLDVRECVAYYNQVVSQL